MKDIDTAPTPIRKTVTVPLPPGRAFALFTEGIGTWWPGESHSLSAGAGVRPRAIAVSPGVGGRITETTHDGRTEHWATIRVWAPGRRLAFSWHVGRPEAEATDVDVTFTEAVGGTRIDLVHSGWERTAVSARRDSHVTGWDVVLGRLAARVERVFA